MTFPKTVGFQNTGEVIANVVIIKGTTGGLFLYNGNPQLGNPPILAAVPPGVTLDPFGNAVQAVLNIGTFTAAHIGWDANGNTYVSDTNGITRIVVTGGAGGIWPGAPDPAIIFYNAFGAIVLVVDPQRGGTFQYVDNNSNVQGGLIGAQTGKNTNDPIGGGALNAGVNIINPAFGDSTRVTGSIIVQNSLNWNTPYVQTPTGGAPAGAVGPAMEYFSPGVTAGPNFGIAALFGESPDTTIDAGLVLNKNITQSQPVKNTSALLETQGVQSSGVITPWTPGSLTVLETWHTLGALTLANLTLDIGRYRTLPDGDTEIDFAFHTTGATAAFFGNFANALPVAYRPTTQSRACGIGLTGNETINPDHIPSILVSTAGAVSVALCVLPNGVTGGCTFRFPVN
jgi:hypothetical protein